MRVGIITHGLTGAGKKPGGVGVFVDRLANGLAFRGHDVTVWSYELAPPNAAYRVLPLPASRFVTTWLGKRLTLGYLGNIFCLLADYSDRDILLAQGDSLFLPLLRLPLIRVIHGSGLGEALSATSLARMAMQFGVYAQEIATALTQRCIAGSRNTVTHIPFIKTVIPYGVDLAKFYPRADLRAKRPTILFVGTLEGRKRGATLISWFDRIVRCRIAGAELQAVVDRPGPNLENVTYHVGISEADLIKLYQQAWVLASASTYEGFGLPYLEAMACGTPVITTPNPGSREVLDDGKYGVLASDDVFPDELVHLLTDAGYRTDLAMRGLARSAACSFDRTLDDYEAALRAAAAGSGN